MFSKTCEYAIRAIMFIAHHGNEGLKLTTKEISKGIDSPEHFIAKILQELGKKGLVQSAKGPHGGFYLDQITLKKSIADVVLAIDGNKLFERCGLGLNECSESNPCPIHNKYRPIKNKIAEMLYSTKLEDLKEGNVFLRLSNLTPKK